MSRRYGADQGDFGAKKRARRTTFTVRLACEHERKTWKVRTYHGTAMCGECKIMVPMELVRMGGAWLPLELALARLRIHDLKERTG